MVTRFFDYPAAVAGVLAVAGAPSVQMVVHCFGSTTFFMAMLAGLQGVRSAVCSQIATDIVAPTSTKIKTGLHMPSFLKDLGIKDLTACTDKNANWQDQLFNSTLNLYPVGQFCPNPVCRRITFLYAPLYEHAQLNTLTHDALHEMFGVAVSSAFEHLGVLVNAGVLLDTKGKDVYLPHLDRLAIPITFIHGAETECFLPKSTEDTLSRLRAVNDKNLYSRYLIPKYGHIDCIFGKNAVKDVYPLVLKHLEATL